MTEGTVTANAPEITRVQDVSHPDGSWYVELSTRKGAYGTDCVQIASVNTASKFVFPPDLEGYGPNGEERYGEPETFDGWRVTLSKQGLADLIAKAQEIHDAMPD